MKDFKEETLKSEEIYSGRIISLRQDDVKLPGGQLAKREIVEHPGAVTITAVTGEDEILLIRQFRKPVEDVIYEIPAGLAEKGEKLIDAAQRELLEETGFAAKKIKKVMSAYTSPGYSTEELHYFLAEELVQKEQNLDADEIVKVEKVAIAKALAMIKQGIIKDNKTIIGIMLCKNALMNL